MTKNITSNASDETERQEEEALETVNTMNENAQKKSKKAKGTKGEKKSKKPEGVVKKKAKTKAVEAAPKKAKKSSKKTEAKKEKKTPTKRTGSETTDKIRECFKKQKEWTIRTLSEAIFKKGDRKWADSQIRNHLRRVIEDKSVKQSGRGTYTRRVKKSA